ncbi:uncharacterized protein LOC144642294 [Oculina patagonica]
MGAGKEDYAGHVSFPKSLRERRLCLFVESDKLKDLGNKASLAVINVKSSCIHKLENEDDDDYGRHVLVIFEFEILTNQTSVAVSLQPYDDYEEENAIVEMPWLDITLVDCNCSRFPNTTNIAVQTAWILMPRVIQMRATRVKESLPNQRMTRQVMQQILTPSKIMKK